MRRVLGEITCRTEVRRIFDGNNARTILRRHIDAKIHRENARVVTNRAVGVNEFCRTIVLNNLKLRPLVDTPLAKSLHIMRKQRKSVSVNAFERGLHNTFHKMGR